MNLMNDKFLHFVFGIAIFAILVPFGNVAAAIGVFLIAVAKELYDKRGHGTPDTFDVLATMSGAVALYGWFQLIVHIRWGV